MSRRKRRSAARSAPELPAEAGDHLSLATSAPDPPRPKKGLLILSGALLAGWILLLIVLAMTS